MEIEKAYFSVQDILKRWQIAEADLIYLAENDKLRLSIRVFGQPMEFGDIEETAEGEGVRIPWERTRFSGLLDLHACDAFQLCRCGELYLSGFRTPRADYAVVADDADPVFLMIGDLLVRRDERDRFEAKTGFSRAAIVAGDGRFSASRDYQDVYCNGHHFHLGSIQAQVVRALHEKALTAERWQSGKAILALVGSKSLKMSDVFKSQKNWRSLIKSDGRGLYRINCSQHD